MDWCAPASPQGQLRVLARLNRAAALVSLRPRPCVRGPEASRGPGLRAILAAR